MILGDSIQSRFLLVVHEAVELVQRRLHGRDTGNHRLDALLHRGEPAGRRQRYRRRTRRLDLLRRGDRCIGEVVEGRALHLGGIDHLRDQVDREAGDFTAVLAAQQRQPVRVRSAPRGGK